MTSTTHKARQAMLRAIYTLTNATNPPSERIAHAVIDLESAIEAIDAQEDQERDRKRTGHTAEAHKHHSRHDANMECPPAGTVATTAHRP
jgi:hypothetical protein